MEEGLQQQQEGSSVYNQAASYGYGSSLAYDQSEDIESAARNALLREQVHFFLFLPIKFQKLLSQGAAVSLMPPC